MNPAIRLDQHIYQKNDFSPFRINRYINGIFQRTPADLFAFLAI